MELPNEKQEENEKHVKPKLKVIRGGLAEGGPPTHTQNWLSELEVGSIFKVQDRQSADYLQQMFQLIDYQPHTAMVDLWGQTGKIRFPITPHRFCNKWDLVEVTGVEKNG
jgi:hypothetical protein